MKCIALGLAFTVSLCGCGSTPSAGPHAGCEVDQAKVAAVERAARQHGVGLIWVNQPLKRAVAGG